MSNNAKYIDHTNLKPEATSRDIEKLITQAKNHGFKTVCVNSSWVKLAKEKLAGADIGVSAAIGFPLGATSTQAKAFEAKLAIDHGADEIDMVINIGRLKENQYEYVLNDIKAVRNACGERVLKVIVETALLSVEEIKSVTKIVLEAKADFIVTSTGFSYRGASIDDIKLMKEVAGTKIQIKAAGSIKTRSDMEKMLEAGASRIGTSASVDMI